MSITDSTTTLDTTWTEQSFVAFTTGVLSDEDACVSEVQSKLKRGTLSSSTTPTLTEVKNWLARAKLELAEAKDYSFNRKFAQATLTAGSYRVSLPSDYNGGSCIIRDTTHDRPIYSYGSQFFDAKYPDPSAETSNEPYEATIKNMELWLEPPCKESTVLEIEYLRSGAATTSSDFSWLPEIERFRCCDFAISMGFESLHNWELADRFLNRFAQGIGKSIKSDGRRKWKRMVSATDVFSHYRMTGNQVYRTR